MDSRHIIKVTKLFAFMGNINFMILGKNCAKSTAIKGNDKYDNYKSHIPQHQPEKSNQASILITALYCTA